MNYTYFTLDKNPKQIKKVSIGGYEVTMRIEWNSRSNCWYVLGYVGNDLVLRNTKVIEGNLYSFDQDSDYYLPHLFTIQPKYKNYDWDTEALMFFIDDNLAVSVDGLLKDGGLITRHIATSSNTHSKVALRGADNKYLFDMVKTVDDSGVQIVCANAVDTFESTKLPQGRWDFTINSTRAVVASIDELRDLLSGYGVEIVSSDGKYLWVNNSQNEIKIEANYPYASGYDFDLIETSNNSLQILSRDNNGWVNRFAVCLLPFVDTVWEIYKTEVSEDYDNLVFRARKSLTGVIPSEEEALLEKYKSGIDPYSATIVNELTGVSDWVLDPANNQIKYSVPTGNGDFKLGEYYGSTMTEVANLVLASGQYSTYKSLKNCQIHNQSQFVCFFYTNTAQTETRPFYGYYSNVQEEEKTLPLPVVAQKVISNAANGDVNAEELLNSLNKYDSYAEVEIIPLIVDQYKQGLDVYSSGIADDLTGVSDWVLDSANSQIKYKEPIAPSECLLNGSNCPDSPTLYTIPERYFPNNQKIYYSTAEAVGIYYCSKFSWSGSVLHGISGSTISCRSPSGDIGTARILESVDNPAYDPDAKGEEKILPLPVVAQQVISNAESGNVDAQKVALSAALSPTLVRSLSDSDMQQWQAVKDAIGQLTGATEWTFDNVDEVIRYVTVSTGIQPSDQHIYNLSLWGANEQFGSLESLCNRAINMSGWSDLTCSLTGNRISGEISSGGVGDIGSLVPNPNYDPNAVTPTATITYQQVVDKIIANSIAEDQGISLLAEAYMQEALLKFADVDSLTGQFEANKTLK